MKRIMIALASCALVRHADAQQPASPDMATALKGGYAEVSEWVAKGAALVPAEKYAYKPVGTVRTYGELVGHVADGYNYFCGLAAGKNRKWSDAVSTGKTDKATITAKLKQAADLCAAAYGPGKTAPPLMANIAHSHLHYGNMITYIRMLGLVPPSS